MRAPLPATIADEVVKELANLVTAASCYADRNDLRVRRLSSEIDKLIKVDAAIGHLAKAGLFQLYGDAESMRYHVQCASKLISDPVVEYVATTALSNLGFFSEAQEPFRLACDPRRGSFTSSIHLGPTIGAVAAMARLTEQADRMGLEIASPDLALAEEIRAILELEGVTDQQIGAMLDVAGEIMREEKLFFVGRGANILPVNNSELGRCVYYTFALSLPSQRVSELQFELACRLVDRFPEIPTVVSVGFRSALAD